jgi:hypothetical protein
VKCAPPGSSMGPSLSNRVGAKWRWEMIKTGNFQVTLDTPSVGPIGIEIGSSPLFCRICV